MTRVGILGTGQLGMMLSEAARTLGLEPCVYGPESDPPAARAARHVRAGYDDHAALAEFARGVDWVTYEFENIPVGALDVLGGITAVHPPRGALAVSSDRLAEKEFFESLGIKTAPFRPVSTREELRTALEQIGFPAFLKTRRFGYDGKGQWRLSSNDDLAAVPDSSLEAQCILEGAVPFDRELSVIAVRSLGGEIRYYDPVENEHRNGILVRSIAPASGLPLSLCEAARNYAGTALDALDYTGVLTIELFECAGELMANEMAPRVHNSGHWTIEGAETSQFENHIRAAAGLPLGPTGTRGNVTMFNLIGEIPRLPTARGVYLHDYGKQPRGGRKLGHLTVVESELSPGSAVLSEIEGVLALPSPRTPRVR